MKSAILALLCATLPTIADAHYLFGRLILDGEWTDTWEYVRKVSPDLNISSPSEAQVAPNIDPTSTDLRCGRNASESPTSVKVATVQAGDTVGFACGEPMIEGDVMPWMYHPGFASAWLSKSPTDDLDAYTGDGDWFKILSVTGRTEQSLNFSDPAWAPYYDQFKALWGTYRLPSYNFTIPTSTPPGKYLLRFEHIFPNEIDAQYYIGCAHIDVQASGETVGTPAPLVKIPGVYTYGQDDVYFDTYSYALTHNMSISDFKAPAPEVWTG